jgi:hypothetical protein
VLDEPLPPPAQAGSLAEVLSALLVRDPVARPGLDVLDRMLVDAQRDQAVWTAPPATGVDPFAADTGAGYRDREDSQSSWTPAARDQASSRSAGAGAQKAAPVPKRAPAEPDQHGGRRVAVVVASVAAIVLVGALLWVVTGGGSANATGDQGASQTAGPSADASPSASSSPSSAPSPSNPGLLTAAGMSTVISALTQAVGGTQVLQLTVYPTYALAEVPDKTNTGTYDNYSYSNGQATFLNSGGLTPTGDTTMNMNSVTWSVLPTLLQKADTSLNVPNPTSQYVVMDPNWPEAASGPSLRVYVGNAMGATGYLLSDTNGNIMNEYPSN